MELACCVADRLGPKAHVDMISDGFMPVRTNLLRCERHAMIYEMVCWVQLPCSVAFFALALMCQGCAGYV